jgi:hypothetical protein
MKKPRRLDQRGSLLKSQTKVWTNINRNHGRTFQVKEKAPHEAGLSTKGWKKGEPTA